MDELSIIKIPCISQNCYHFQSCVSNNFRICTAHCRMVRLEIENLGISQFFNASMCIDSLLASKLTWFAWPQLCTSHLQFFSSQNIIWLLVSNSKALFALKSSAETISQNSSKRMEMATSSKYIPHKCTEYIALVHHIAEHNVSWELAADRYGSFPRR